MLDVPLEWCFKPGVKLDFRHFPDGYVVTAADVESELRRVGHEIKPLEMTGTDAWSWDAPFVHSAKKYAEPQDASLIWEGHKAGRDIGYSHFEKLHKLEALPVAGFTLSCFPHKIGGAAAGWTRAVAIFDDRLLPA